MIVLRAIRWLLILFFLLTIALPVSLLGKLIGNKRMASFVHTVVTKSA